MELADARLSIRRSHTALLSVDCVVLSSGDVVDCHISSNEKIHGIAVNYSEMNPFGDVLIKVFGGDGKTNTNFTHKYLPAEVTHKTRVLFLAGRYKMGSGMIQLLDCAENARFAKLAAERLEISGVLVGADIPPLTDWGVIDDVARDHEIRTLLTLFDKMKLRNV